MYRAAIETSELVTSDLASRIRGHRERDPSDDEQRTVAHTAELDDYQQQVTVTKVGNSTYLDEGNRVQEPLQNPPP